MNQNKLFTILAITIAFVGAYVLFGFVGYGITATYDESAKLFKKALLADSINKFRSAKSYGAVTDDTGTPLFFYAKSIDTAKYLMERNIRITKLKNAKGETVLHYIINHITGYNHGEKVPLLKYYLREGLDPYQPSTSTGATPKDLMEKKTCKGKKFFWDNELLLLVNEPNNELLALNNYDYTHTFTNPRMDIISSNDSNLKMSKNGYEFFPEHKSNNTQKLTLSYRGSIQNRSLSISIHDDDYDFETCEVKGSDWVCNSRATGRSTTFEAPQAMIVSNMRNVLFDSEKLYPTYANSKNLQPTGKIYLSYNAEIPDNFVVSIKYPKIYNFDSIKFLYGSWVGNKN